MHGAELAEGLAAIHDCGLVHRDLKPSNVILAEDGPRIIDCECQAKSPDGRATLADILARLTQTGTDAAAALAAEPATDPRPAAEPPPRDAAATEPPPATRNTRRIPAAG